MSAWCGCRGGSSGCLPCASTAAVCSARTPRTPMKVMSMVTPSWTSPWSGMETSP
uniref:Alternative protein PLXNA3 n=1 Tax=Homo sapiens TaxID=9606 RepID=L8ECH0_HUMAN|nr:alternative protein PLXNA3 [Homo sapiens]